MRGSYSRIQKRLRIRKAISGIYLLDGLNRDTAGLLTTFIPAHTVRHNRQPPFAYEFRIVRGLPIFVAILVVFSMAADIGQAPDLYSGADFRQFLARHVL